VAVSVAGMMPTIEYAPVASVTPDEPFDNDTVAPASGAPALLLTTPFSVPGVCVIVMFNVTVAAFGITMPVNVWVS